MEEIIFVISEAIEGGFTAEALSYSIFTEAQDWDALKVKIKEAVLCHFDDTSKKLIRLHFVRDEVMAI